MIKNLIKAKKDAADSKQDVPAALASKKTAQKKFLIKMVGITGATLLITYGVYLLFSPHKGGIAYGTCLTFLQSHTRYPDTIKLNSVEYLEQGASIRIWYSQIDSFGQYRLEPIQCYFRAAQQEDISKYGAVPFVVEKIKLNKLDIENDEIDSFNKSILGIVANPPDLILPYPLPTALDELYGRH